MYFWRTYHHPLIGDLFFIGTESGLTGIFLGEELFTKAKTKFSPEYKKEHGLFDHLNDALERYFAGEDIRFDVPLQIEGTLFQKAVWEYMRIIPYGETRSYSEAAIAIGRPKAVRAVGQASRVNPFPIIIPCHRLIGKNGSLTGYAGSKTDLKRNLLHLESTSGLLF
ncbi:methylated-DNA-[protein]-cysteine S-methyltransferase [Peribacillus deserti]|uniref:Methylated-DNA-[protein]-cysteine S-methyltransferase n=1 Tax=Peribacillus deserti TaxID=673318 RepID=A0ABS2QJI5_9BACI|nr:methylated-DNA--[protein]-cysteine S-methyltransferase [Peribacillus deserti]MBM7693115.1 methylated-DNA-[protein]-cysteine S-methyltransferase [Peribacillus deserti]